MKKIIASLFLLLCVFGSPVIEICAEGVQDDNPVENTHNNDENQNEDSNEYEPSLCIGNKGEK